MSTAQLDQIASDRASLLVNHCYLHGNHAECLQEHCPDTRLIAFFLHSTPGSPQEDTARCGNQISLSGDDSCPQAILEESTSAVVPTRYPAPSSIFATRICESAPIASPTCTHVLFPDASPVQMLHHGLQMQETKSRCLICLSNDTNGQLILLLTLVFLLSMLQVLRHSLLFHLASFVCREL